MTKQHNRKYTYIPNEKDNDLKQNFELLLSETTKKVGT